MITLLLAILVFGQPMREVSAEEAAKHLQKKVDPVLHEPNMRISGDVVLQLEISKDGTVNSIKTLSGHPMLIAASLDAVRKWTYTPFLLDGKPIPVKTTITIPFGSPHTHQEALREEEKNNLFYKTIDLCRKQIADKTLQEAEVICRKTIALSAELDDSRQLERMEAVRETGDALFLQRKFSDALDNYQAELRIGEKILKPYEAELGSAHYHVANGLWGTGHTEEAIAHYEKAESIYKQAREHINSPFLKNEYAKKLKLALSDHVALLRRIGQNPQADILEKESANIQIKQGLRDN